MHIHQIFGGIGISKCPINTRAGRKMLRQPPRHHQLQQQQHHQIYHSIDQYRPRQRLERQRGR